MPRINTRLRCLSLLTRTGAAIEILWNGPSPHNLYLLDSGICPEPGEWVVGQGNVKALLHPTAPTGEPLQAQSGCTCDMG